MTSTCDPPAPERRIILARHGRPLMTAWRLGGPASFRDFLATYDAIPVDPAWPPPPFLIEQAHGAATVFCGTAARARTSAEWLSTDTLPCADPLFAEAPLPWLPLPVFLPLPAWTMLARLAWLGGRQSGESPAAVAVRAEHACDRLERATSRGAVFLLGHGWFNRALTAALRRRGWRLRVTTGNGYWSHRALTKVTD